MTLRTGNMWESGADVIVVTGNATVRGDGRLVMGRGAAREAAALYPELPAHFGSMIQQWNTQYPLEKNKYGVLVGPRRSKTMDRTVAIFQVKLGWWEKARLDLIANSSEVLRRIALGDPKNRYALNFPGIGNGRLKREEVLPIVERLPANVEIWTRSENVYPPS